MEIVAPILPVLLVAAALSAQFSAAVADTSGAGGLIAELSKGRMSPKAAYSVLVGAGLLLTWTANVFEIISYASRASTVVTCLAHGHSGHCRAARPTVFARTALLPAAGSITKAPS